MTCPAAPGDSAGQNVTNIVKDCIQMLGSDAPQFSGKSMLLGGLSMAITGNSPLGFPNPYLPSERPWDEHQTTPSYFTTLRGRSWRPEAVIRVDYIPRTRRTELQPSVTQAEV